MEAMESRLGVSCSQARFPVVGPSCISLSSCSGRSDGVPQTTQAGTRVEGYSPQMGSKDTLGLTKVTGDWVSIIFHLMLQGRPHTLSHSFDHSQLQLNYSQSLVHRNCFKLLGLTTVLQTLVELSIEALKSFI